MFVIVTLVWLCCGSRLYADGGVYLTYDRFIEEVEAGSVQSVELDRFSGISGTFIVDGNEMPFRSYGETGTVNDVLLSRLLEEHGVAINVSDPGELDEHMGSTLLIGLVMFVAPLVTLVLVFRINSKLNDIRSVSNDNRLESSDADPGETRVWDDHSIE